MSYATERKDFVMTAQSNIKTYKFFKKLVNKRVIYTKPQITLVNEKYVRTNNLQG